MSKNYRTDIKYNEHSDDGTIVTKTVTFWGDEVFAAHSDGVITFIYDGPERRDTGFVCSLAAFVNMRCEPQTGSQIGAGSKIGSIS